MKIYGDYVERRGETWNEVRERDFWLLIEGIYHLLPWRYEMESMHRLGERGANEWGVVGRTADG